MTRIADHDLAHHFEIALSVAGASLLADLQHAERHRRSAAVSALASHLATRMRRFEISLEDGAYAVPQPSLFPDDLGPLF
jgi:hypothetical protein